MSDALEIGPAPSGLGEVSRGAAAPPEPKRGSGTWIRWAVLAWAVAISVFHLVAAAKGRPQYRDSHIGTALEYAKGSINLLKPIIIGFNLNGAPTPQELPIWQATAALAFKAFGTWFGWANVVSLIWLFSCLYPLFKLAKRYAGAACAWWTLLLFLAQPLVFLYGGVAGTDGESVAVTIWFLFFGMKLFEEQTFTWLVATVLMGALAAVSKLPFLTAAGLGCAFMALARPWNFKRLAWLTVAGLGMGVIFLAWNQYVASCYAQAERPYNDLRLSAPGMAYWWFGDLKYRLTPGVWVKAAWRILNSLFGSFSLAGVLLLVLGWRASTRLGLAWLAGGVATTLIFSQVVLGHYHYYLLFAPALALACAPVAARLEQAILALEPGRKSLTVFAMVAALALSTFQGLVGIHVTLSFDDYPYTMAAAIKAHTSPTDKLVIYGAGWGGNLLLLSERKGLMCENTQLLEDEQFRAHLKELGFTKLVMVSESPFVAALERTTGRRLHRQLYEDRLTPPVRQWPSLVQTEDILIKDLP